MTSQIKNIKVSSGGRGWSSGTAEVDGRTVSWEAYRKDATAVRVMLAQDGRWMQPGTMGLARLTIEPTARGAMQ